MKKTRLALLSMIVFITVFSLTAILDLHIPFKQAKGRLTQASDTISAESKALAEGTQENEIHSLSVNISPSPDSESAIADIVPGGQDTTAPGTVTTAAEYAAEEEIPEDGKTAGEESESKYANIGISTAKYYVNIRKKDTADSSVLGKLYRASAAKIIKTKGDWYYVVSGNVKGYVKSKYIKTDIPDNELVDQYGILSISVSVKGLNVRNKPSAAAKKVTVIHKNETYPVVDLKGRWIEIKVRDQKVTGYIKKEYAHLTIEFKEAISKEEEQKLKKLEAERRVKEETVIKYHGGRSYSSYELKLLACLIQAEAGSQSYQGKLAVANVVLNRVKSSRFPGNIKAVIYSPGQFTVARTGALQRQLNNYSHFHSRLQSSSIKAAKDALKGANNIGARMYFHSYGAAVRKGYDHKSTSVRIGALLFW